MKTVYIVVITKLPNSEQSYKGKVKTHNYINTKSVNNRKTVKTVMTLTWYRVLTIHDVAKALDSGDQIDGILLDFSKAFYNVPHNRLLMKLDHYGVRNNT
jgi:hypothetical protein